MRLTDYLNIPGILAKYKALPTLAERALVSISSSSCGIGSSANPHLNNDLGTIIAFPGETFGLRWRMKSNNLHAAAQLYVRYVLWRQSGASPQWGLCRGSSIVRVPKWCRCRPAKQHPDAARALRMMRQNQGNYDESAVAGPEPVVLSGCREIDRIK
jgi:hypothetical protein